MSERQPMWFWKLYLEDKKGQTTINDVDFKEPKSIAEYTRENPQTLYTAIERSAGALAVEFNIRFYVNGGTTKNSAKLKNTASLKYHEFVIFVENEQAIVEIKSYDDGGVYQASTEVAIDTAVFNPMTDTFSLFDVLYSSTTTTQKFNVYRYVYEVPEVDDIDNYRFTNIKGTYAKDTEEGHYLVKELTNYSSFIPNKNDEYMLPYYGKAASYDEHYIQLRFTYVDANGAEVIKYYSSSAYKYKYCQVAIKNTSTGYIQFVFYYYDEQGTQYKGGIYTTACLVDSPIQLHGFYSASTNIRNYDHKTKELYPIRHEFDTIAKCVVDSKDKFDVISTTYIEACNKHDVQDKVKLDTKATHNTSTTTYLEAKNKFDVRSKVKYTSKVAFNTKEEVKYKAKQSFNVLTKTISNTKSKLSFNTVSTINCIAKTKATTKVEVKKDVKSIHNTVFKPLISIVNKFSVATKTKLTSKQKYDTKTNTVYDSSTKHSTTASIVSTSKIAFNTVAKTKPIVKTAYDIVVNTKAKYINKHDTEAKVIVRTKNKFNTSTYTYLRATRSFNTVQNIDIINTIKMYLGITDTSKDPILKYLVQKAIDDMHLYCNLTDNELISSKSKTYSLAVGYFPADSMLGTNRQLQTILIDLVIYYYQMRGMEHLKSESVEGASWSYISDEIPKNIQLRLKPYKKVRAINVF